MWRRQQRRRGYFVVPGTETSALAVPNWWQRLKQLRPGAGVALPAPVAVTAPPTAERFFRLPAFQPPQPVLIGGHPIVLRRLLCVILVPLAILIVLAALALFLLAYFNIFNILVFVGILHSSGHGAVAIPVCNGSSGVNAVVRLVYDPSSQSVQDVSGAGCSADLGGTQVTASGVDPLIGPYWMGYHQRGVDLVGCTSYSWTQWLQTSDAIVLANQVMSFTAADGAGPFPLSAFLLGCGIAVLGSHTYAIPQNTWVHLAIVYDGEQLTNTYFVNGQEVFTWAAYTDPPPAPYLKGTMTLDAFHGMWAPQTQVLFGPTHLYCAALAAPDVLADAGMVTYSFPPRATAYPPTAVTPQGPLPAYTYAGNTDTNDLASFFCSFPTQADEQAVPSSLPAAYTTFYVDQVNGADSALGTGTGSSAWKTLVNTAIFGNLAYDFAILSTESGSFANGVPLVGASPALTFNVAPHVVSGAGILPNSCNLWYFQQANTGSVSTTGAGENEAARGGVDADSTDGSSSMWLSMSSVTGAVSIPPNGGYSQLEPISTTLTPNGDGATYTYSFGSSTDQLSTTLSYGTAYYVTQVWSCSLQYLQLWVNGQLVSSKTGGIQKCPYVAPGLVTPFLNTNGGSSTFTGYLGAMSMHYVALPNSAVQALYRVMSAAGSTCALADLCLSVQLCQGSRFFGVAQGVQLQQSGCPPFLGSYDCGYGTDQPLISGAVILPQTSTVGWQQVSYTNPSTGATISNVLMYDLVQLYQQTGTAFLPANPLTPFGRYAASSFPTISAGVGTALPGYMPIVMNDLSTTPRAPNMDDPRYPLGNRFYHSLHPLSYLSDGKMLYTSTPNAGFYPPSYYQANSHLQATPGSWCNMTWNQMFGQNTAAYLSWASGSLASLNADGLTWGFQYTYDDNGGEAPTFGAVGSGVIDCQQWYNTEILGGGALSAPNLPWTDPSLALYGLWPGSGYVIPQCAPACTDFYEYLDQIYPPSTTTTTPPPLTPNPMARAPGGWQSQISYFFQGDQFNTVWFDGPCEAYHDQAAGRVYYVPCTPAHRDALLTVSGLALDATVVAQNPALTANWARLMDRSAGIGVTVGYSPWVAITSTTGAIVQDIAISHYNGWGLVEQGTAVRVENVALSYNLNHIRIISTQNGASNFILSSTGVNTTRPWYGVNVDTDGIGVYCDAAPLAVCALLDSDFVTTVGPTTVHFMRNVRMVDNAGQSAINTGTGSSSNKLWIENSLFNITEMFVGDAGTIYSDTSPTTFLWTTFDNTMYSQGDEPQLPARLHVRLAQGRVPPRRRLLDRPVAGVARLPVSELGRRRRGAHRRRRGDELRRQQLRTADQQPVHRLVVHVHHRGAGPDAADVGAGRVRSAMGLQQLLRHLRRRADERHRHAARLPCFRAGVPGHSADVALGERASRRGSAISRSATASSISSATHPPPAAPSAPPTSPHPRPRRTAACWCPPNSPWRCRRPSRTGPTPRPTAARRRSLARATCQSMKATVQQRLANEGQMHYAATQAAMLAIVHSQLPFYVPASATPLVEASDWEEPMSRYNPSGPAWPPEPESTFCSDEASCAPYLLTQMAPRMPSSTWVDLQSAATVAFVGFDGLGDYSDASPRYVGTSYDVDRGAVIDTCFAQGLEYTLSYPANEYLQFTVMFWWQLPHVQERRQRRGAQPRQAAVPHHGRQRGGGAGGAPSTPTRRASTARAAAPRRRWSTRTRGAARSTRCQCRPAACAPSSAR